MTKKKKQFAIPTVRYMFQIPSLLVIDVTAVVNTARHSTVSLHITEKNLIVRIPPAM